MDRYIKYLSNQFKEANGLKRDNLDFVDNQSELFNWLIEREKIIHRYIKFLDDLGLEKIKEKDTFEVNKGFYDSIGKDFNTSIITSFSSEFPSDRIINGDFIVFSNIPIINSNNKVCSLINNNNNKFTFMTQNPYNIENIYGWDKLANSNNYDIVLGMYGLLQDKDKENKIKLLKKFKEKLLVDYMFEYLENGNEYYSVISTGDCVKKRLLKEQDIDFNE